MFFISALIFTCLGGFCQADSTAPVYLRFPVIPQFTVYKAPDSTAFSRDDLQKKEPVVFMIFSPDCEHCQLSERKLGILDELAAEREKLLKKESAELEQQATRLAEEIKELGGAESSRIL